MNWKNIILEFALEVGAIMGGLYLYDVLVYHRVKASSGTQEPPTEKPSYKHPDYGQITKNEAICMEHPNLCKTTTNPLKNKVGVKATKPGVNAEEKQEWVKYKFINAQLIKPQPVQPWRPKHYVE